MWGSIREDIRTTCTYITNITHPSLTLHSHSPLTHTHPSLTIHSHTLHSHSPLTHTHPSLTIHSHSSLTHNSLTHTLHSLHSHSLLTPLTLLTHTHSSYVHSTYTHPSLTLCSHSLLTSPLQGYLFVSVIFGENHDLMPLVIQAIRLDLQSPNSVFKTLAMQCVANIGSKQMAAQIGPEIPVLLTAR